MEKEIGDINATLTLSFLNRRHTALKSELGVCPRVPLLPAPQRAGADWHPAQRKEEMMSVSVSSRYLATTMLFGSDQHDHPSSPSPGKLTADMERLFHAESKVIFQKLISTDLCVFKHVVRVSVEPRWRC